MRQHPLSRRHLPWLLLALLIATPARAASPDIVLRYGSTHGDYERLGVADIDDRNDGIDLHQLAVGMHF